MVCPDVDRNGRLKKSAFVHDKKKCPIEKPSHSSFQTAKADNHTAQVAYEECLLEWGGGDADAAAVTRSWLTGLVWLEAESPTVLVHAGSGRIVRADVCLGNRLIYGWPLVPQRGVADDDMSRLCPVWPLDQHDKLIIMSVGTEPESWRVLPVDVTMSKCDERGASTYQVQNSAHQGTCLDTVGVARAGVEGPYHI